MFDTKKNIHRLAAVLAIALLLCVAGPARAQTPSTFIYQGQLTDGGAPASGAYQMQFKLFDALMGGEQVGATIPDVPVNVTQGIFTTRLDFGAEAFPGADRFLEIAVKKNANDPYTALSPRQQIAASPYSIRTLSAAQADVALDAQKLGGVDANQYVTSASIENSFIQNGATPQANASFNIDGNGVIGGNLGVGTPAPTTRLQVRTGTGFYGFTHTDGTTTVGTYVGSSSSGASGGWLGTLSNHNLHFFTNNGQPTMTINTAGNVGIGTASPQAKLHLYGNAAQDRGSGGLVKALLYVGSDGSIQRCYNGLTGSSAGDCGFTVSHQGTGGFYQIYFGFDISDRFISLTTTYIFSFDTRAYSNYGANFSFSSSNYTVLEVTTFFLGEQRINSDISFMVLVY